MTDIHYIRQVGPDPLYQVLTTWEDLRFPFFGRNLDVTAGHLDYNIAELGIAFDDTSRYNDADQIGIIVQMAHRWKIGTALKPHIHWIQSSSNIPNMLLKYRVYENGQTPGSWNLAAATSHVFTYTAGSILQASEWPDIVTSSITSISAFVDLKVYRDVANASGEFSGSDPLTGDWLTKELDIHYEIDTPAGSSSLWMK